MKYLLAFSLLFTFGCTQKVTHKNHSAMNSPKHNFVERYPQNMSKPRRTFDSKISVVSTSENSVTLKGHYTPSKNNDQGHLMWRIGSQQAKHTSGNLESNVKMVAGQTESDEITIADLKVGDRVIFLPYFMKNDEKHGAPAIYVHGETSFVKSSSPTQKPHRLKVKKRIFQ